MCHDKDNVSMIKTTGSSNPGHGLCCKPGFSGEHCNDDGEHVCSQAVAASDTTAAYKSILTGTTNNQMFAFCPKTTAKMCGVSSTTTEDDSASLVLDAYTTPKTISLKGDTALQYKEGGQATGKFQSCYYKINAAHSSESSYHHDTDSAVGKKTFLRCP